jgi:hypothetical protein
VCTVPMRVLHDFAFCTRGTKTSTCKNEAVEPHTKAIIERKVGGVVY